MSYRDFDLVKLPNGRGVVSAMRIECRCGAEDHFIQSDSRRMPPIAAVKAFRKRGWRVATRAQRDLCPACHAAGSARKTSEKEVTMPATVAEKPREPDFDTKRIITARLHDVYLDASRGYSPGWSDHRISEELKIPRAWITSIREFAFGPAADNEDVRKLLADVAAVSVDLVSFARAQSELAAQAEALRQTGEQLAGRVREIERLAKPLRALVPA